MPPKKLSGAEFRKLKQARQDEHKILSHRLNKWISTSSSSDAVNPGRYTSSPSSNLEPSSNMVVDSLKIDCEPMIVKDADEDTQEACSSTSEAQYSIVACDKPSVHESTASIASTNNESTLTYKTKAINHNNPKSWPKIDDKFRCYLVENGPSQGKNYDFRSSISDDGRIFSGEWFKKTLPNNEKIDRKWLIYSENNKALFCFPCLLFTNKSSAFSSSEYGFRDWKHLNPRIGEHENSMEHRRCYVLWRELEIRLKKGVAINDDMELMIVTEQEKWKYILKVILDIILFCAKNNLALRGKVEQMGHRKSGIFLSVLEILSKYNPRVAAHTSSITKGSISYLSPSIQNEFIDLLGSAVRNEIISVIKKSKYYCISFDCTPDVAHKEQMAQIVRYVRIKDGNCTIEESFIDFIETSEKTGNGLAEEIVTKIRADGLHLSDCRGQSYDNGANMAGKYRGVQSRILQQNEYATYLPCAAHSLNLIGVHAASVSHEMVTFFGTLQQIFTFFSGSTRRWEALSNLKFTLKGHSDTRWSSKSRSVHSLLTQLPEVLKVLQSMSEGTCEKTYSADSAFSAQSLIKLINFQFICLLTVWNSILSNIDKVNNLLQYKTQSIERAAKHIDGLQQFLKDFRENGIDNAIDEAKNLCHQMTIKPEFMEKRKRKTKKRFDEKTEDEGTSSGLDWLRIELYKVLDTLISQIKWRFNSLSSAASDFSFLTGVDIFEKSTDNLKKSATDLALKYKDDLDAKELTLEIESFKYQACSLLADVKNTDLIGMLNFIHEYGLTSNYPNIEICLRLALTLPVTSASCERSFSKLKLVKTYLRSQIGQERLTNLAILSIEYDTASQINYDDIIQKFASQKSRKIAL